jgi:hypothetical protein
LKKGSQQNLLIPRNASRKEARQLILDAPIKQKCMVHKTKHANAAPTQDGSQPKFSRMQYIFKTEYNLV